MTNDQHLTESSFGDFNLEPKLVEALSHAGFTHATPVQQRSIPLALAKQDIMGQAQTGTGKTLAFVTACLNYLMTNPPGKDYKPGQPRALIIAPSRELAIQIHKDFDQIATELGFNTMVVYGGIDYEKQKKQLQAGTDILIGTPGRVIDYFKQRFYTLDSVQTMILDEADRMFDLGFIKDIRFILRRLPHPEKRLNMLFSATLSHRVMELAYEHMNAPQLVQIETPTVSKASIKQYVYYLSNDEKIPLLIGILQKNPDARAIVFVNTKAEVEKVTAYLLGNDIHAAMISGDVPQKKRQRLVLQFQTGEFPVLVATDIAARGLHVPNVTHVINYDLPNEAEDYVHRIGRTGRAGETGIAISFACEKYSYHLPDIEELGGISLEKISIDPEMLIQPKKPAPMKRPSQEAKANQRNNRRPNSNRGNRSQGRSTRTTKT